MNSALAQPAPIPWEALLPLIAVATTGIVAMLIEMIWPRRSNDVIVWICIVGLAAAAGCVVYHWNLPALESFGPRFDNAQGSVGGGLFLHDRFGQIIQLTLIATAFLTVIFSEGYLREKRLAFGEFYPLVMWAAMGGMIMATSRDLLIVFLGLETLSIALYVLAGLSQKDKRSQESALKYFLLGAFASGFMLYGISLIYGATGTTNIAGISELFSLKLPDPTAVNVAYAGMGLILVGFAFKVALVPFHMWTPDVYQGAPTVVTGFMAAASKVAAFAALIRFLDASMAMKDVWIPILTVLAVITMTVGNLIALAQKDAKRILGYSSIAQAGYILVAIVAWAKAKDIPNLTIGYETVAFYLIAYTVMTIGAFAVLSSAASKGKEGTLLEDLYGMWRRAPFPAAMMIVFMASLAGVPPTGGFFGKLFIFFDAVNANLVWLALILALNSVISVAYYLKIVQATLRDPEVHPTKFAPVNVGLFATCFLCAIGLFAIVLFIDPLKSWLGG